MIQPNSPDPQLDAFLVSSKLVGPEEEAWWHPLTGGVSSDIWRVDLSDRSLCVKRALPTLKVAANWEAPISRNADEWSWMQFAAQHCPDNVPAPLAHDPTLGVFAMSFLEPLRHPVWKAQLMSGQVDAPDLGRDAAGQRMPPSCSSGLTSLLETRNASSFGSGNLVAVVLPILRVHTGRVAGVAGASPCSTRTTSSAARRRSSISDASDENAT